MKNQISKINKKFSFMNRFLTGLVIALAATLTAFEWTTVTTEAIIYEPIGMGDPIEMDEPLRFKIKKLEEPKPKPKPSDDIKVVKDIPDETKEIEPDEVKKDDKLAEITTDFGDFGDEIITDEIDVNKIYVAVQVFAHYDECASLEGEALKECSQLAIMTQIKENFAISRQLRDTGGKQAAQVSFIVDQNGNIENIEILKSTCKAMAKDARKALEKLPPMNPAVQQGRNVKLQMTIPIVVRL